MRRLAVSGMVLATLTILLCERTAQAAPNYRERIEFYDITDKIESYSDFWDAIRDWGPSGGKSNRFIVGLAKPRIGYSYKLQRRNGLCYLKKLDITVSVVMRLPGWSHKDRAKPHLKRYYSCVLNTTTVHEKRHAQIAYEAGEDIEKAFYSKLDGSQCQGFAENAKRIYHRLLDEHNHRQADFDRRDYARNRYQLCEKTGEIPTAHLNSQPEPTRFNLPSAYQELNSESGDESIPLRTDNEPRNLDLQPSLPQNDVSFEVTKKFLAFAGYLGAAITVFCGFFIAVMLGASRYERYRERPGINDAFAHSSINSVNRHADERTLRTSSQRAIHQNGFGKRGRYR